MAERHATARMAALTPPRAGSGQALHPIHAEHGANGVVGGEPIRFGVSGQPVRELAPAGGLRFNIREQTGFSVEFRKDASGAVTEAVLYQPNGTFIARRR